MKYAMVFFLFCYSISGYAADFDKTGKDLEEELIEVNKKLDTSRTKIFQERAAITQSISETKTQLQQNKKSSIQLNKELNALLEEISELELKIKVNTNSNIDLFKSSIEARRELETAIPKVWAPQFEMKIKEQDKALDDQDLPTFLNSYEKVQSQLISTGSKLTISTVQAVGEGGRIKEGKLISPGYSQTFLLIENKGGLAEVSQHHSYPSLKIIPGSYDTLKTLSEKGSGFLIFDFSNGLALKKEAAKKTFGDRFNSGGVIMYPLLILAILCILTGVWKSIQLYIIRSSYDDKVSKLVTLIKNDETAEAGIYIQSLKGPVKSLLSEALKHRETSRENLEELLNENILTQIPKLDRFMPVLSVSAGAAPLLGLLGTVMGIIKTFEMISLYGTGDPNTMAGGISEALVTTQAGLMVAIPALIWHALLNRRMKTIVGNLEKAMLSFINALSLTREKV